MNEPLVTVIVPAFDAEAYLADAIESVLAQDYPAIEIIVVDDGSTDGTAATLAGFEGRVRVITQANAGTGAARNRGIEVAGGGFLFFLDADDRLSSGALEHGVRALTAEASLEAVFGNVHEFVSPELPEEEAARLRQPLTGSGRMVGAMLIRADAFRRVGPWSETLRMEAVEWMGRAEDCGLRWRSIDVGFLQRRLHRANKGRDAGATRDYALALKSVVDQRRRRQTSERSTS